MANSVILDMRTREFWISLTVAVCAFLITYHLPRILKRNAG
jgi:hypothetical protein